MIDFLVLYDARSGSTFLSRKLMESYEVLIPPEANFFSRTLTSTKVCSEVRTRSDIQRLCSILAADFKFSDWEVPIGDIERALDRLRPLSLQDALGTICRRYGERHGNDEPHFGIKKGSYIYVADRIRSFFPEMKFVCLIRDGRAVFASKKQALHSASRKPFATHPVHAARRWSDIRNRIRRLEAGDPARVMVIKYEDLVRSPEAILSQTATFLGLSRRSTAIDAGEGLIPDRYQHLHLNTGKNAQSNSIDKWRQQLSSAEVFSFEAEASEALTAEGYPLVHKRTALRRPFSRLVNLIKSGR